MAVSLPDCEVHRATSADHADILAWLREEDMDLLPKHLTSVFKLDEHGFFIARLHGEVHGMCFGGRFEDVDLGIFSHFFVTKRYRQQGIGRLLWRRCMEHIQGLNINIMSFPHMADFYRRNGFPVEGVKIHRLYGHLTPVKVTDNSDYVIKVCDIQEDYETVHDVVIDDVMDYDKSLSGMDRSRFLRYWLGVSDRSHLVVTYRQGRVVGYTVVQEINFYIMKNDGDDVTQALAYRIEPLYADTPDVFKVITHRLCDLVPPTSVVTVDVPEVNTVALTYFRERCHMTPRDVLDSVYSKQCLEFPLDRVYGRTLPVY